MGKRSAPSPGTIALAGLMLLALAVAFGIANSGNSPAPQADEIEDDFEFKPEEVDIDEGSATLKVEWAAYPFAFESSGQDDISLNISWNDTEEEVGDWIVQGRLASTQSVRIAQGQPICWHPILHQIMYNVFGIFVAADCEFKLAIGLAPTSSEALPHGCSIHLPDVSGMYMSPKPPASGEFVFTRSWANPKGVPTYWTLMLVDVILPTGISCPGFSQ